MNIFVGLIIIINVHPPIRKLPLELFFFYLDDDYVKIKIRINILMSIEIINEFEKESG